MGINLGVLTANRGSASDECFTPFYAVQPLLKYIKPHSTIWIPFDEEWSAYNQLFIENGHKVLRSTIREGQDFFKYEPLEPYDIIISNPPYSKKDAVLKRLQELKKPFAMLLPIATLQGQKRFDDLIGLQLLVFDKRIGFHTNFNFITTTEGSPFATAYFCKGFLPSDLIFERLEKYQRALLKEDFNENRIN